MKYDNTMNIKNNKNHYKLSESFNGYLERREIETINNMLVRPEGWR